MTDQTITVFKTMSSHELPEYYPVGEILRRIKRGDNKALIQKIRNESDKGKRDRLKKQLLWICFSGKFSQRLNDAMIAHSGLMCLDFDNMDQRNLTAWRGKLKADPHTLAMFLSPSGNGLKVLFRVPVCQTNDEHNRRFGAIAEYFKACKFFDLNVKGWNRVCFESYDPDIYINPAAEVFTQMAEPQPEPAERQGRPLTETDTVFSKLVGWFEANYNLNKGNRNQGSFIFASAVADYISQGEGEPLIFDYISRNVQQDSADRFTQEEIRKCIKQAYFHHPVPTKTMVISGGEQVNRDDSLMEPDEELPAQDGRKKIVFWYRSKKGELVIDYHAMKRFLQDYHYFRYDTTVNDYIFVHIENNTVEQVSIHHIKDFVLVKLEEWGETQAYNLIAGHSKFKKEYLNLLDCAKISWLRDSPDTSYVFFRNCAVKIQAEGLTTMEYNQLEGHIWKSQKLDRDFSVTDYDCDASRFILNVNNKDPKRTQSYFSALGYLMHGYKDVSRVPVVVLIDEVISDGPTGGSGKSLSIQMCGHIRKMEIFDGKNFTTGKSFPWQRVSLDTQIIFIDDIPKNFDMEKLFSITTQGIPVEKKNRDEMFISFEDSPKMAITTNNVIKGDSVSHNRRKFELELHPHYNESHQPIDEFGRPFFNGWDSVEWNKFDNFMVECIRFFLRHGLVKAEYVNLKFKKLVRATNELFPAWAKDNLRLGHTYKRVISMEAFREDTGMRDYPRAVEFLKWVRAWADYNGWEAQDCGGGKQSVMFTEAGAQVQESEAGGYTLPF